MSSGTSTNTATITAVGANAFLVMGGFTTTEAAANLETDMFGTVVLTNSTTVTATRSASVSGNSVFTGYVVDPSSSLVTGIQAGTITLTAATSNTATITSVNTALSAVFFLGSRTTSSGQAATSCGVTLTNATTVTATCNSSTTSTVSFVVVTFASSAIQSIQKIANATTAAGDPDNVTITSVNQNNVLLAYGGQITAVTTAYTQAGAQITSATNVAFTKSVSSTTARTEYNTVVEFKSGVLNQAQQSFNIDGNGGTTNTATISSVNTSNALTSFQGCSGGNQTLSAPGKFWPTLVLTNATTVTMTIGVASASTSVFGQVVEFSPPTTQGNMLLFF